MSRKGLWESSKDSSGALRVGVGGSGEACALVASTCPLAKEGARVELALERLASRDGPGTEIIGDAFLAFHLRENEGLIAPILAAMPFNGEASERCRLGAVEKSLSSAGSYSRKRASRGSSKVHSASDIRRLSGKMVSLLASREFGEVGSTACNATSNCGR